MNLNREQLSDKKNSKAEGDREKNTKSKQAYSNNSTTMNFTSHSKFLSMDEDNGLELHLQNLGNFYSKNGVKGVDKRETIDFC